MNGAKKEKEAMARLEIRLPKSIKQKLIDMCGNQISASEFIRQIIDSGELPDLSRGSVVREKREAIEPLIRELSRIGNNVNQLARSLNIVLDFYNKSKDDSSFDSVILGLTCLERLEKEVPKVRELRDEIKEVLKALIEWSNER